jgi:hypothetical protein
MIENLRIAYLYGFGNAMGQEKTLMEKLGVSFGPFEPMLKPIGPYAQEFARQAGWNIITGQEVPEAVENAAIGSLPGDLGEIVGLGAQLYDKDEDFKKFLQELSAQGAGSREFPQH